MRDGHQICSRCIMDTSDPDIVFDEKGVCSHCHQYEATIRSDSYLRKKEKGALEALIEKIKEDGKGQSYDCIIGVSGGVDSTYVAYVTKELGLRALAVHMDNGWDSELAVSNIEKALRKLNIDLYTNVLDWEEFRDIQLAFLKASVPDLEIPTDHAIHAVLYEKACRENVKYILGGDNTASEGGGVAAWSQGHADWLYIRGIRKRFGTRPTNTFPHFGILQFIYYAVVKRIKWIPILDYVDYNKKKVLNILQDELEWKAYPGKHLESFYTKFYQSYILPKKFGYDKKRLHLSSLIWSGQISRDEALKEMSENEYTEDMQRQDREYVIKKFGISEGEFDALMNSPAKSFWDYPSYKKYFYQYKWLIKCYHRLKRD